MRFSLPGIDQFSGAEFLVGQGQVVQHLVVSGADLPGCKAAALQLQTVDMGVVEGADIDGQTDGCGQQKEKDTLQPQSASQLTF